MCMRQPVRQYDYMQCMQFMSRLEEYILCPTRTTASPLFQELTTKSSVAVALSNFSDPCPIVVCRL